MALRVITRIHVRGVGKLSELKSESQGIAPLLLHRSEAAKLAGVSAGTWDRLVEAKKAPAAVRPSVGCLRWRRVDVERWIDLGCPTQESPEIAGEQRTESPQHG